MGRFGTGQAIRRSEDQRFITGSGRYTDDLAFDGQAFLYFFRSPYAHGIVTRLDTGEAQRSPGVIAVYTAADLAEAGVRDVPGAAMPASSLTPARRALRQPPLARDRVRYVGEPVAAIVAETLAQARDAAELIELEVDELDAAVTVEDALQDGATTLHEEAPGNHYGTLEYGDAGATDAAFAQAKHIVTIDIVNNRLAPTPMEPRGCNVIVDRNSGRMIVHQGCQGAHALRERILETVDLGGENLDVLVPDVGGAFGLKAFLQCETVLAVFACKSLGRPVKWTADRSESFLADVHGRDHVSHGELGLDEDGRMLAMRAFVTGNVGAYCSQAGPIIPWFGACMTTGVYDIPVARIEVRMAVTNTVPVDAYRGAGRPEAAYLVERLVDKAARQLGIDRVELRRRNFIAPERFPYRTATGRRYDSGEYANVLESALARAEWDSFETRRARSAASGRLRGIGLAYYVEICSLMGGEDTHVRLDEDGRVTVLVGTQSTGQGHETTFAQMVAGALGVNIANVHIVQGDTARIPTGEGTAGSRTMAIAGSSLSRTLDSVIESGRRMAAELLEAATVDVELDDHGGFRIAGTDRRVTLADTVAASFDDSRRPAGVQPGLACSERFVPEDGTFPNGCHVCEVAVDPETGIVEILRYTVEDDVGNVINPLILEGQIVGGVAQGLGQAFCEQAVYDRDGGQLVTATFMDYAMPRAEWVPPIDFHYREVPSPRNPLGVKGAGEAGTVGSAPAFVNAVLDALSVRGIEHVDMPLTPMKVWALLHPMQQPP
ncbi:MAG TPA: xanthine dehydrogenase family protein molybdopterin-binding subunit [Woeseiaceae bacterium]|nr:xanthine dehydrogenase family protein molybdopterin-binding subunit [Woeseiaceae bacterium]